MSKRFKFFDISNEDAYSIYGTVDKDKSDVLFSETKLWVKPEYETDYTTSIETVMSKLKRTIMVDLRKNGFENRFIFDYTVNSQGLSLKQGKLMTIELVLKQDKLNVLSSKDANYKISSIIHPMIESLIGNLNDNGFITSKVKMRKS